MTQYFISFNDGDMTFPEQDFAAVGAAAHAVMADAIDQEVWVHGGGFWGFEAVSVSADGTVTEGPLQESPVHIGGFAIVNVDTDEQAHDWARRFAIACRCSQEVRKIMDDHEQLRLRNQRSASDFKK